MDDFDAKAYAREMVEHASRLMESKNDDEDVDSLPIFHRVAARMATKGNPDDEFPDALMSVMADDYKLWLDYRKERSRKKKKLMKDWREFWNRSRPMLESRFTGDTRTRAAGVIPVCSRTGRLLLQKRAHGPFAGSWGTFGGRMEKGENSFDTAEREFREETGFDGKFFMLIPVAIMAGGPIRYTTFVGGVEDEFHPALNDESRSARWFDIHEMPAGLHPGLKEVMKLGSTRRVIADILARMNDR